MTNNVLKNLGIFIAGVLVIIGFMLVLNYIQNKAYDRGFSEGKLVAEINYLEEINKLNSEARSKELALQLEMDEVRREATKYKEESEVIISSADTAVSSLQLAIENIRQASTNEERSCSTESTRRIDEASTTCWNILSESIREYQAMGREADRLLEQLRIGQGWGLIIESINKERIEK